MVRAILEGRKTQTRRVLKPKAADWLRTLSSPAVAAQPSTSMCHLGYPGDRLWVREEFAYGCPGSVFFSADDGDTAGIHWKPSIYLPKWASRITLEITEVRVERLQDISETDAVAEGIEAVPHQYTMWKVYSKEGLCTPCPKTSYWSLWTSINDPKSWDENPWVWAITFKSVQI